MSTFERFAFRVPADESDDPDRAVSQPNCLAQFNDTYASEPDEQIARTLEKEFDEQDGQSDNSQFHTPAQPSKRRRLLSDSPFKQRKSVGKTLSQSDSALFDRAFLFETHVSRNHRFWHSLKRGILSRNGRWTSIMLRSRMNKSKPLWSYRWTMQVRNILLSQILILLLAGGKSRYRRILDFIQCPHLICLL